MPVRQRLQLLPLPLPLGPLLASQPERASPVLQVRLSRDQRPERVEARARRTLNQKVEP